MPTESEGSRTTGDGRRLLAKLRLILGGHPLERMDRVQKVRDEMLLEVRSKSWDWRDVEEGARDVHADLKQGRLPDVYGEIQQYISGVCAHYYDAGYPLEDLREAVDGVKAKAAARQRIKEQQGETQ